MMPNFTGVVVLAVIGLVAILVSIVVGIGALINWIF